MPINKGNEFHKFEVVIQSEGWLGGVRSEPKKQIISVKTGETEIETLEPRGENNRLIITQFEDDSFRAEINNIPVGGDLVDRMFYRVKEGVREKLGMKDIATVMEPSLQTVVTLETPIMRGKLQVKVRRLS